MSAHSVTAAEVIQILMQKYSLLKQDIFLNLGFYKQHVRNLQILGAAILAVVGVVGLRGTAPTAADWWLWWAAATLTVLLAGYLVVDVVQALYALILLSDRMATLEKEINKQAARRLLIWESEAMQKFYGTRRPLGQVVNPDWALAVFAVGLFVTIGILTPCVVYVLVWLRLADQGLLVRLAVILGLSMSLGSGWLCWYTYRGAVLRLRGRAREWFEQKMATPLPASPD